MLHNLFVQAWPVCNHQIPADNRKRDEEDRREQHFGIHRSPESKQIPDQNCCQEAVRYWRVKGQHTNQVRNSREKPSSFECSRNKLCTCIITIRRNILPWPSYTVCHLPDGPRWHGIFDLMPSSIVFSSHLNQCKICLPCFNVYTAVKYFYCKVYGHTSKDPTLLRYTLNFQPRRI